MASNPLYFVLPLVWFALVSSCGGLAGYFLARKQKVGAAISAGGLVVLLLPTFANFMI